MVSVGEGVEREQPPGVSANRRRPALGHDVCDVSQPVNLASVAEMNGQAAERDDARGVEYASSMGSVFEIEATLERRPRLGWLPRSQQQPAEPDLEHLVGPALPVAPGRSEAVGRDIQRIVMPIEDAEQLTVPPVFEPKTLIVSREDPVALGGR